MPTLIERLWRHTTVEDRLYASPYWIWNGFRDQDGYGRIQVGSRPAGTYGSAPTHRTAWSNAHGPIPEGLQIDHECLNKGCWRPAHLALVTPLEQQQRKAARRTTCLAGHEYSSENTRVRSSDGARCCRVCDRLRMRSRRARAKGN